MKESKFTELVNSYFDREITVAELESLRQELAVNPERRREFEVRYRLHKAMCVALSNDDSEVWGRSIARKTSRKSFSSLLSFGLGVAACIILSVSFSVFRESKVEFQLTNENSLKKSDIERYMENQAIRRQSSVSLASQLRLVGLTPDIAPAEQQLNKVDAESMRRLEIHRQHAINRVNKYKTFSAFSELQLNEASQNLSFGTNNQDLLDGFQSTLASF